MKGIDTTKTIAEEDKELLDKAEKFAERFANITELTAGVKALIELAYVMGAKENKEISPKQEDGKCYYVTYSYQTSEGYARNMCTVKSDGGSFPLMEVHKSMIKRNPKAIENSFLLENVIEISKEQCEAYREWEKLGAHHVWVDKN